jgi:hypothetical protein
MYAYLLRGRTLFHHAPGLSFGDRERLLRFEGEGADDGRGLEAGAEPGEQPSASQPVAAGQLQRLARPGVDQRGSAAGQKRERAHALGLSRNFRRKRGLLVVGSGHTLVKSLNEKKSE